MGEQLVVASKVKAYIKSKGGMNTASSLLVALTEQVQRVCDQAIENARSDGRKTVMDRDISGASSSSEF